MYRKEKKKAFKNNPYHAFNWAYDEEEDAFTCPNGQKVTYQYLSKRTDQAGFKRTFKVYKCEYCTDCSFRGSCTKAKEGKNSKVYYNEKWENQKKYIRELLSETETGEFYGLM